MIIAKDDEIKRSKIWTIVTSVTSVLIILIAAFFIIKLFMSNPLEGTWESDESSLSLKIRGNSSMTVSVPEVLEDTNVELNMDYSIDKEAKTITIEENEDAIAKAVKKSDGGFTKENLENALSSITTTFDYSVDQEQMTLTEREYGEQMIFIKQ